MASNVEVGPDMPSPNTAGTENNLPQSGYRTRKLPMSKGPKRGENGEYKPARYKMKSGTICQDN
jgi:hypothetical protein